ncbi:hypothetical protein EDD15DRAFT_179528 [Pisolithus albus]|nr:hypothetical protein EDD15DRAFT_179528 [Pisolithus albus]
MSCNTQIAIGAGKICHFIFFSHLSASSLQSSVMSPRDTVHVSKCKRELSVCSLVPALQPKSTCKKSSFLLTLTSILSILNVDHFVTSTTLPLAKENTHRNNVRNKCSRAMGENDILIVSVFSLLLFLLFRGICRIFPSQLVVVQQRAAYYLWGNDTTDRALRYHVGSGTVKDL